MTPELWQRAKDLFAEACERPAADRAAFLAEACHGDEDLRREVSSLLESHEETGSVFDAPMAAAFAAPADTMAGRSLGAYRIIRRIGRGGMGSVYLAERADDLYRRRVAVKTVTAGLVDEDTLRRFQNERQTLAALDHPNIIKLLDGGTSEDGTPYLVMDYVEGQSIDEYVKSHKLSTAERLDLFRTVCSAVTYAHQNLVVHRDLKPSNILITPESIPKLLDFGIAKLLKPEYSTKIAMTRTDLRPMTPEYASPEQLLGQPITTASDIYSLGVLLYRLLTGFHPYQLKTQSAVELERAICRDDPEKPSVSVRRAAASGDGPENLARRLKGDLDMIVLMAMRKEPQRRYPTVEHLSEDIRRHLEGLPVAACKDTLRYRAVKFCARHKAGVAAAAVIIVALMASTWIARSQQLVAEKRFQDLRQFANFALTDLDDAMRKGVTPARKMLVGKAAEYLDTLAREARNDASIRRDLIRGYLKMGDVQGNLYVANVGESSGAEQSYRKALAIAEKLPKSDAADRELALANYKLADAVALSGNGKEALERYGKARQIYTDLRARNPSDPQYLKLLMQVWDRIASTQHQWMGDEAGALQSYQHCLELARQSTDPKARSQVAFFRQQVALFAVRTGDPAGAEDAIREAIQIYESSASPERNIAKAYKYLADVEKRTGKLPEALESARKSLKITDELLQDDPRNTQFQVDEQQALALLIDLLHQEGNSREERAATERALRFLKPLVDRPDASVYLIQGCGELLVSTPFPDLADNTSAFRYARMAVSRTHEKDPTALDLLARAYGRISDFSNAAAIEQKAIALLPPPDPTRGAPELRKMLEAHAAGFRPGAEKLSARQ